MKTKWILILSLGIVLTSSLASADYTLSFGDKSIYWPTWATSTDAYGPDNTRDVIGNPNITGGVATLTNDGYLKSIRFNYTASDWNMLTPGNLFINIKTNAADNNWNYVVNTMGYSNSTTTRDHNNLAAGNYSLFGVNVSAVKGTNNTAYILSGQDVTGAWSGYDIRDNHPIGLQANTLTNLIGNVYYSGWPGKDNPTAGHSIYDFTSLSAKGLYLGANKEIVIGWETTCANDVIYETVKTQPVPLPAALWLLGSGLIGLAGFRRVLRK